MSDEANRAVQAPTRAATAVIYGAPRRRRGESGGQGRRGDLEKTGLAHRHVGTAGQKKKKDRKEEKKRLRTPARRSPLKNKNKNDRRCVKTRAPQKAGAGRN